MELGKVLSRLVHPGRERKALKAAKNGRNMLRGAANLDESKRAKLHDLESAVVKHRLYLASSAVSALLAVAGISFLVREGIDDARVRLKAEEIVVKAKVEFEKRKQQDDEVAGRIISGGRIVDLARSGQEEGRQALNDIVKMRQGRTPEAVINNIKMITGQTKDFSYNLAYKCLNSFYEGWFAELDRFFLYSSDGLPALRTFTGFADVHGMPRFYLLPRSVDGGTGFHTPSVNIFEPTADFLIMDANLEISATDNLTYAWFRDNGLPFYADGVLYLPTFDSEDGSDTKAIFLPIALHDATKAKRLEKRWIPNLTEVYGQMDHGAKFSFVKIARIFLEIERQNKVLKKVDLANFDRGSFADNSETVTMFQKDLLEILEAFVSEQFNESIAQGKNPDVVKRQFIYTTARLVLEQLDDGYRDLAYLKPYIKNIVEHPEQIK